MDPQIRLRLRSSDLLISAGWQGYPMTYDNDKGPDLYELIGLDDAPWPVRQAFRWRTLVVVGLSVLGVVLYAKGLLPW